MCHPELLAQKIKARTLGNAAAGDGRRFPRQHPRPPPGPLTSPDAPLPAAPGFGRHFFRQSQQLFANEDAAYVLAYGIIMLNTDLHNSQVGAGIGVGHAWVQG